LALGRVATPVHPRLSLGVGVPNNEIFSATKGGDKMSGKKTNSAKSDFTPTFKKLKDMSASERNAFDQGCITANNSVKERLGFRKPRES